MQLSQALFAIVAMLFLAVVGMQLFTSSINYGGYTTYPNSNINSSLSGYINSTNSTIYQLQVATSKLSSTNPTIDPLGFFGALTTSSIGAATITLQSLSTLTSIIVNVMLDLAPFGISSGSAGALIWIFASIFFTLVFGLALLSLALKWWV